MVDVSIVIVNYNTCELTTQCISSIYNQNIKVEFEIILVDNASTDDTVLKVRTCYPNVVLVQNDVNYGFGKANNIGVKYAKGKYLLLLNSDTLFISDVVTPLYNYMEKTPSVVSCGCNLIDIEGKPVVSYGHLPSFSQNFSDICFYRLYRQYYKKHLTIGSKVYTKEKFPVEYICGADIFIRAEIYNKLNGFDEDFFMYYEETDLYCRLKDLGLQSVIIPDLSIIHLEGGSMKKRGFNEKKFQIFYKSKILYYRKRNRCILGLKLMDICFYIMHLKSIDFKLKKVVPVIIKS